MYRRTKNRSLRLSMVVGAGALAAAWVPLPAHAAAEDILELGAQIRIRGEIDARDFNSDTQSDDAVSHRVRLNVKAKPTDKVSAFIQFQDVRIWGEEENTLVDGSADAFDLHQGYIRVDDLGGTGSSIILGRQEVNLGEQRLVGAVGWTQNARSLDGVHFKIPAGENGTIIPLAFLLTEKDAIAAGGDLKQLNPGIDEGFTEDTWLAGAHSVFDLGGLVAEPHAYYLRNSDINREFWTLGAYLHGSVGLGDDLDLIYNGTFDYQVGSFKRDDPIAGPLPEDPAVGRNIRSGDISAYLVAAHVGIKSGGYLGSLGYEYLSGDDDLTDLDSNNFDTLLATNHKFYGHMDYFLNNGSNTASLGLQDIVLKARAPLGDSVKLGFDAHYFLTAETDDTRFGGSDDLGTELDLWLDTKWAEVIGVKVGYSVFFPGDAMEARFATDTSTDSGNTAHWAYLQTNLVF